MVYKSDKREYTTIAVSDNLSRVGREMRLAMRPVQAFSR